MPEVERSLASWRDATGRNPERGNERDGIRDPGCENGKESTIGLGERDVESGRTKKTDRG